MAIRFRNYSSEAFFSNDYRRVREFLVGINRPTLQSYLFPWARWEWMITHAALDRSSLGRIGLWERGEEVVGMATYESVLGDAYLITQPGFEELKAGMLDYSRRALSYGDRFRALIDNTDRALQRAAFARSFRPTQKTEETALLDISADICAELPDGFHFVSLADDWNFAKYNRVMWRGFDHAGEPPEAESDIEVRRTMLSSPAIIPELVICVVAPNGDYASHCGMWFMPGDTYAYVEPVATDPDYRGRGLGRAAVFEAARRCGALGAKQALCGTSQQFYYNIGFCPVGTATWWEMRP